MTVLERIKKAREWFTEEEIKEAVKKDDLILAPEINVNDESELRQLQIATGKLCTLIDNMEEKGGTWDELDAAYYMLRVCLDARKLRLDWKLCTRVHDFDGLNKKYHR